MAAGEHSQHAGHFQHADHHAATGEHAGHGENGSNSICPFAAAGMGAPAPHLLTIALAAPIASAITVDVVAFQSPFGPSRAQQSRAPPYFS